MGQLADLTMDRPGALLPHQPISGRPSGGLVVLSGDRAAKERALELSGVTVAPGGFGRLALHGEVPGSERRRDREPRAAAA